MSTVEDNKQIQITLENLYNEYIEDFSINEKDIVEYCVKKPMVYQKWLQLRYMIRSYINGVSESNDTPLATKRNNIIESIKLLYLRRERIHPVYTSIPTQNNVMQYVNTDKEFLDFEKAYQDIMMCAEFVEEVITYAKGDSFNVTNINNQILKGKY